MIPTPQPRTYTQHPEVPDAVAFQPIPVYHRPPGPPQTQTPKENESKLYALYGLMLMGAIAGMGWMTYQAGVNAGESGSTAKIQQLETHAAATDARIESFCGGVQ